jgi:RNA polymerase sigma-70 factor, ECF subfamily
VLTEHVQDKDLARDLARGDRQAFARFFDDYAPRLYRFALQRLNRNADAAEEVAQRTLCRAVRKIGQYRGEASLFTWLCQICISEDDPEARAALESLPIDTAAQPASMLERSDVARLVQAVLDHLPTHYANALEWKYIEDLEVHDIADRLQLTPLATQSLLHRARTAFRNAWQSVVGESLERGDGIREGVR